MDRRISIDHLAGAPVQGLLSSTVVRSTTVHAVLPATLREPNIQDIVFVYGSFMVVKEYINGGLHDVTIKDDFDANISATKVLGHAVREPRRRQNSRESDPGQLDSVSALLGNSSRASSHLEVSTKAFYEIPPQILVMTLKRDQKDSLVFLYAKEAPGSTSWSSFSFESSQRALPFPHNNREALRYGRHLAVDSGGRVIAVGANEKNIILYRLKPKSSWLSSGETAADGFSDGFEPVAEERRLEVNGTIHKMEFLESPRSEPSMVILLLIIGFDSRRTVMQRYDWDSTKPLSEGITPEWPQGYPLEPVLSNSQILMPLCTEPGFVLVAYDIMARFSDVLTGAPKVTHLGLPAIEARNKKSNLSSDPIEGYKDLTRWTAWAKPNRRADFTEDNDHFFLCREDGLFQFFELIKGSGALFSTTVKMDITNDTAFAVLDSPDGSAELVVTSNGLFRMPVQDDPSCEQPFYDWSPLQDFLCVPDQSRLYLSTFSARDQGLHSKNIHHIYTAYKARILDHKKSEAMPRSWVLSCTGKDGDLCLVSSDEDTRLQQLTPRDPATPSDLQIFNRFNWSLPTLCTGYTNDGKLLQVTPRSLKVFSSSGSRFEHDILQPEIRIAKADFDPYSSNLVLILAKGASFWLQCFCLSRVVSSEGLVLDVTKNPRKALSLDAEPTVTCISRTFKDDSAWAAVGNWKHELLLVKVDGNMDVHLACLVSCDGMLFESLRLFADNSDESEPGEVVCGLRDGHIARYRIDREGGRLVEKGKERIGKGPVVIDRLSHGTLVALCDGRLLRGELDAVPKRSSRLALRPLVLMDSGKPVHDRIFKISQPSELSVCGRNIGVFYSRDRVYVTEVGNSVTQMAEPRTFFVHDTGNGQLARTTHKPTHTLESSHGTVVAYQEAVLMEERPNGAINPSPGRRQLFSRLGLLDSTRALHGSRDAETDVVVGKCSGEFVRDLVEWKVQSPKGVQLNLIVACTERRRKSHDVRPSAGRLYLYAPSKNPNSRVELDQLYRMKFDEVVSTAVQITNDSFAVCHGESISLVELRDRPDSHSEFKVSKTVNLRSPGRQIATKKLDSGRMLLYVATDNSLEILYDDLLHVAYGPGDYESRGHVHLVKEEAPVTILLTSGSILGFTDDIDQKLSASPSAPAADRVVSRHAVREIFEAKLLHSVSRIVQHPSNSKLLVGGCISGAIFQFRVLCESEWQLLRFLENVSAQDPSICPLTFRENRRFPRLKPVAAPNTSKEYFHINGDILDRLMRGGKRRLRLSMENAVAGDLEREVQDWQGRQDMLEALVGKVGIGASRPGLQLDSIDIVMSWLREVLEPCI